MCEFWHSWSHKLPLANKLYIRKYGTSKKHFEGGKRIKKKNNLAGNRTPVSCVTDRDTHHYTTKELYIKGSEEHEFEGCTN